MEKRELITWRGTPGVGDFMWALNCAHKYCFDFGKKVTLEFQWEHDEDYLHHFEEEETIIERLEYIHNFYHRKDDVEITHVFNAYGRYRHRPYFEDTVMTPEGRLRQFANHKPKNRFWFASGAYSDKKGAALCPNDWTFRFPEEKITELSEDFEKQKIVVWTPLENAEIPRSWKNILTYDDWQCIISILRQGGVNVVELTYRTPIREAMYHIMTSKLVVCYDGMWHYIAKNLHRPMIVVSSEGITTYHTPHAWKMCGSREEETKTKPYILDLLKTDPMQHIIRFATGCRNGYYANEIDHIVEELDMHSTIMKPFKRNAMHWIEKEADKSVMQISNYTDKVTTGSYAYGYKMECGHQIDTPKTKLKFDTVLNHVKPRRIFEIGFNGGHSARRWLDYEPLLRLHSVDYCRFDYTRPIAEIMLQEYGKFSFQEIDSLNLTPEDVKGYDLLFVDGDHTSKYVTNDVMLGINAKVPWILVDDYKHKHEFGGHLDSGNVVDAILQDHPEYEIVYAYHYDTTDGYGKGKFALIRRVSE